MISYLIAFSLSHRSARRQPTMIKEVRFAPDSALEGSGFELPVPREIALWSKSGLALHLGSLALRRRGPDWNGRPTAEAWVSHREEIPRPHPSALTASPRRRCFRTRCVSTDLSPGPHTRGKTRALPPCFYRRHRAHSPVET